jgi:hypothetical protein
MGKGRPAKGMPENKTQQNQRYKPPLILSVTAFVKFYDGLNALEVWNQDL